MFTPMCCQTGGGSRLIHAEPPADPGIARLQSCRVETIQGAPPMESGARTPPRFQGAFTARYAN